MTATEQILPSRPALREGQIVLGLFSMRWLAGVLENFDIPKLSEAAALIMLAGLVVLFLQRGRIAKGSATFFVGMLAWVLAGSLSYLANPDAQLQQTIKLLTLLFLYGLFANTAATFLTSKSSLKQLSVILAVFVLIGTGLSLLQIATGTGFLETGKSQIQRAFGSDVHPVSFAIQMVAALVTLEIIRTKLGRPFRFKQLTLFGLGALAIYLTFARTAWVMVALILVVALVMRGSKTRRFVTAIGIGIPVVLFPLLSGRFDDLSSLPFFLSNFSIHDTAFDWRYVDNSVSWRIVNWTYGFQQAWEQPWLGFGPGQSALSSYFNLEMHNIFLEVFFEGGLFGLLALLVTLTGLIQIHRALPGYTVADRYGRLLANSFGIALLFAVTFSTSFVDQLMSFLLYLLLLASASVSTSGCDQK